MVQHPQAPQLAGFFFKQPCWLSNTKPTCLRRRVTVNDPAGFVLQKPLVVEIEWLFFSTKG